MFELEESHFWFVSKRLFIKTILSKYLKKGQIKILDIGCGTGGLTKFLKKYGHVIGIDQSRLAVKLARKKGLSVAVGEAERLPFSNNYFNLVTMFDVLYHKNISDVKNALMEVRRVLKPSGLLIITDSAFDFLKSQHDVSLHGKRRFTTTYLNKILIALGFKILKSSYIFFSLFPLIVLKRKVIDHLIKNKDSDLKETNFLINKILVGILKTEALFLRFLNFPVGSSLILAAEKSHFK